MRKSDCRLRNDALWACVGSMKLVPPGMTAAEYLERNRAAVQQKELQVEFVKNASDPVSTAFFPGLRLQIHEIEMVLGQMKRAIDYHEQRLRNHEETEIMFHRLWGKAVGQPGYSKQEWIQFQRWLEGSTDPDVLLDREMIQHSEKELQMTRYVIIPEADGLTFENWRAEVRIIFEFCKFYDIDEARKVATVMQLKEPERRFLICEAIERTSPPPVQVQLESLREPMPEEPHE